MSYIPRPNSGTLWPPENKTLDSQPDIKGNVMIEKSLLQALISKGEDPVKISIAGWKKEINGKECISMKASEPYVKPQAPTVPDEDVPF